MVGTRANWTRFRGCFLNFAGLVSFRDRPILVRASAQLLSARSILSASLWKRASPPRISLFQTSLIFGAGDSLVRVRFPGGGFLSVLIAACLLVVRTRCRRYASGSRSISRSGFAASAQSIRPSSALVCVLCCVRLATSSSRSSLFLVFAAGVVRQTFSFACARGRFFAPASVVISWSSLFSS